MNLLTYFEIIGFVAIVFCLIAAVTAFARKDYDAAFGIGVISIIAFVIIAIAMAIAYDAGIR